MDKIEIPVELLQLIQKELRELRLTNMELHSQLMAVKRCLSQVEFHMPREDKVEAIPTVIAKINSEIEKHNKRPVAPGEQVQVTTKTEEPKTETKTSSTKKKP